MIKQKLPDLQSTPPGRPGGGRGEMVDAERRADEVAGACGVLSTLYPIDNGGLYEK